MTEFRKGGCFGAFSQNPASLAVPIGRVAAMAKTKSSVLRANKAAAKKTIKPKSSGAEPGEPSSGIAGQWLGNP